MRFFVGLDLGQAHDFTAVAVVERTPSGYDLRHLDRLRGQPYPKVVEHVSALMARMAATYPRPRIEIADGLYQVEPVAALAVDATGVGRAVCDLFRAANMPVRLVPMTITSGQSVTGDPRGGLNIPKKDLVTSTQVLFQTRRLRIARELPLADVLIQELNNFRVKVTAAAHEVFEAWREGQHDDLVFGLCAACWLGENHQDPYSGPLVYNSDAPGDSEDRPLTRDEAYGKIIQEMLHEDD